MSAPSSSGTASNSQHRPAPAYVIHNSVHHSRFLPVESRHSFTYPTLSFLLSLSHLEASKLDIAEGYFFRYNNTGRRGLVPRLTSIRPDAYLQDAIPESPKGKSAKPLSIRTKLEAVLSRFGHDARSLDNAWMLTMPSYMGVEGINPLTVYYCYKKKEPRLWIVVLEVRLCAVSVLTFEADYSNSGPQYLLRAARICASSRRRARRQRRHARL